MNHFVLPGVVQRYVQGRPYFHPIIVEKIRTHLKLDKSMALAIDVGCGTGLSAIALKDISQQVIGIDPSLSMLQAAPFDKKVHYLVARAEYLPVASNEATIITVSSAFYWFNRPQFFSEASRILESEGWVIIYDNAFSGEMIGNSNFSKWMQDKYWFRYPYPTSLNSSPPLRQVEAIAYGFDLEEEHYENEWSFTCSELVDYLLSLSNVSWAIEKKEESLEGIADWLKQELQGFFKNERHQFLFHGPLLYLKGITN